MHIIAPTQYGQHCNGESEHCEILNVHLLLHALQWLPETIWLCSLCSLCMILLTALCNHSVCFPSYSLRTMHRAHCAICNVHCAHWAMCNVHRAQCAMCKVQCALCTLHTVQCAMCTVYTVQCTMCTVHTVQCAMCTIVQFVYNLTHCAPCTISRQRRLMFNWSTLACFLFLCGS